MFYNTARIQIRTVPILLLNNTYGEPRSDLTLQILNARLDLLKRRTQQRHRNPRLQPLRNRTAQLVDLLRVQQRRERIRC